ncbi:Endolytic murein transglycosylase [Candidatus Magnetomoraceae bacterium gMMP-1]
MKKFLFILTFLFFISCFSFIFISWCFFLYAHTPAGSYESKRVVIEPGDSFYLTTEKLFHKGIIDNSKKFRLLACIYRYDVKIKAGEYILYPAMSPFTILNTLVNCKILLHKITIPEGYNLKQIAVVMAAADFVSKAEFLQKAYDKSFVKEMGIKGESFEGYLFPDTYNFPRGITSKEIIEKMVKGFFSIFKDTWKDRAVELGFSINEIVTLASIIEKETGQADERPIISSVFHNRLKKNMRLESDPTVIYGIKNFNGDITRKDLKNPTPYNTYVIKGFPLGPIANPGAESLKAALFPSDTPYLYFVAKKDKTHQFSSNLKDHYKAVERYQK